MGCLERRGASVLESILELGVVVSAKEEVQPHVAIDTALPKTQHTAILCKFLSSVEHRRPESHFQIIYTPRLSPTSFRGKFEVDDIMNEYLAYGNTIQVMAAAPTFNSSLPEFRSLKTGVTCGTFSKVRYPGSHPMWYDSYLKGTRGQQPVPTFPLCMFPLCPALLWLRACV